MLVGVAIAGMGGLTAALVQNDKFPRQNKQRHIRRRVTLTRMLDQFLGRGQTRRCESPWR
jgi:hypothetical protein